MDIFDAAWWAEQQRLRFFESPTMEDTADGRPGLEYSSGEDSDMDMGEEVGEEMGEAVDMGEGMGEAVDMDEGMGVRARRAARQKGSSFGPMKEDADRDYSWACSNCTFQNAAGTWQCEMCSCAVPGQEFTQ